eukprot:CAMPEP_0169483982 /NCGR_PEP_ID=MMETSP1042-20121227/31500_1 /TAXON_ID=464988 /ORGANISM="Hemiselmis andersenii, Strain CCMP1180" /LENGTH=70 /DNA_ID=CAMNT_0009598955 /DNA_START=42 /DNA_END=251 /DNA_ORIENTATION=+
MTEEVVRRPVKAATTDFAVQIAPCLTALTWGFVLLFASAAPPLSDRHGDLLPEPSMCPAADETVQLCTSG